MKKIIVTGGAGFIGSALVRFLVKKGIDVCCLDNLTYAGRIENFKEIDGMKNFKFSKTDICDIEAVKRLFSDYRPTSIIHLAAESHVDRSIDDPLNVIKTNVLGTANLLQCSLEYWRNLPERKAAEFRFQHISTDEVFGSLELDSEKFNESTPYSPRSPYSASKASSGHLVRSYFHTFGLPVLISNCSNNYGENQFPEKLIPHTIINALDGKKIPIYGKGMNIRDWIHVEDHVKALYLINEKGTPGETYCIGGNCEKTNIEIVYSICSILDELKPKETNYSKQIEHVTDRPGHDKRYAVDSKKIEELGWKPEHSFEEGLCQTIKWYLDNESWWREIMEDTYNLERLGKI